MFYVILQMFKCSKNHFCKLLHFNNTPITHEIALKFEIFHLIGDSTFLDFWNDVKQIFFCYVLRESANVLIVNYTIYLKYGEMFRSLFV
jgi:hypothetical protein